MSKTPDRSLVESPISKDSSVSELPWAEGPGVIRSAVEIAALTRGDGEANSSPDAVKYPSRLQGYGNQPLSKPRALRGSKLGPASEVRTPSPEEKEAIEAELKKKGYL